MPRIRAGTPALVALAALAITTAALANPVGPAQPTDSQTKALSTAVGSVGSLDPKKDGHRHDTVTAICTAPLASNCYFNILLYRGGVRALKVGGGLKVQVPDLEVGKDLYVVKVDAPAPMSFSTCRAEVHDRIPCVWAVVKSAITEKGSYGDAGLLMTPQK